MVNVLASWWAALLTKESDFVTFFLSCIEERRKGRKKRSRKRRRKKRKRRKQNIKEGTQEIKEQYYEQILTLSKIKREKKE